MSDDEERVLREVFDIVEKAEAEHKDSQPITKTSYFDHRYDECKHNRIDVDEVYREVHCRDCGRQLDAISVLLNWERYFSQVRGKLRAINEWERKMEAKREKDRARREKRQQRQSEGS